MPSCFATASPLRFHLFDGLGLEVWKFNLVAKLLERLRAGLGFELAFDGLVNLAGELGIVRGLADAVQEIDCKIVLRFGQSHLTGKGVQVAHETIHDLTKARV